LVEISGRDFSLVMPQQIKRLQWWTDLSSNFVHIALVSNSLLEKTTTESALVEIGLPKSCLTMVLSLSNLFKEAKKVGGF